MSLVTTHYARLLAHAGVACTHDLGRLHLVPAHIEEFVKAGTKRARLAQRTPEYLDFEPGIETTKSIAMAKPA